MALTRRDLLRTSIAVGAAGVTLPVFTATARAATASAAAPTIASCDTWGARPPSEAIEVLARTPTYIVVHHTAGPNSSDTSLAHAYSLSRSIQNYHMDSNGWIDSGQQLTNSRGGHVTEGRHRSLEVLINGGQHVLGANVGNHNSEVIGIENEGLYTSVDVPGALWNSLVNLVAYIASQYGIAPSQIRGHRDFNSTECPGGVLYGRLPELRSAVGGVLGREVVHPESWPLLKPGDTGDRVRVAQHLLRENGTRDLPVDGVFGERTTAAMRRFHDTADLPYEPCYASRVADERGFVGAGAWPSLVRPVELSGTSEAAAAARLLVGTRPRARALTRLETQDWRALLKD
ncbi:peptidoglycan recognition protein family protein [Actinokineospora bangkokensis]|uniref:N-acetylmuramoyl-L-alanine amidase n=1 Tax=Actinokineospora bangkokensis TaxID=1193682 RepID=A0A1Q9LCL6_9PSEU|nr:N-acetylmuramoyl-L-alanine amidase [Actinokineospora bangkokensis]OLR89771.1 N-acetylmuramoyl-L-alanine amidase [Actinokineospora bangkokensis]